MKKYVEPSMTIFVCKSDALLASYDGESWGDNETPLMPFGN